jgi:prepilin-type N-terminal cleavage/methylation domain-containing protein
MSNSSNTQKGFTIVELLVTMAVMAILLSVSVVGYTSFVEKAAVAADQAVVEQLNIFKEAYSVEHGEKLSREDVAYILQEVNFESIEAQSARYGYEIRFNYKTNQFELRKTFSLLG